MHRDCHINGCKKKSHCDCNCGGCHPHPQPHPPNCQMVIASFHKSINEAIQLFGKSASMKCKSLEEAKESLELLKQSLYINEQGERMFNKAEHDLESSGCKFGCNKNSCQCKNIEKKADYYFDMSDDLSYQAIKLLEEAICKLEESIDAEQKGVRLEEKYVQCIHQKDYCEH